MLYALIAHTKKDVHQRLENPVKTYEEDDNISAWINLSSYLQRLEYQ